MPCCWAVDGAERISAPGQTPDTVPSKQAVRARSHRRGGKDGSRDSVAVSRWNLRTSREFFRTVRRESAVQAESQGFGQMHRPTAGVALLDLGTAAEAVRQDERPRGRVPYGGQDAQFADGDRELVMSPLETEVSG